MKKLLLKLFIVAHCFAINTIEAQTSICIPSEYEMCVGVMVAGLAIVGADVVLTDKKHPTFLRYVGYAMTGIGAIETTATLAGHVHPLLSHVARYGGFCLAAMALIANSLKINF